MKVSAEQLTKGQKFTYGAHSYTALSVEVNPDTTVSVYTEEHPGLPMDF